MRVCMHRVYAYIFKYIYIDIKYICTYITMDRLAHFYICVWLDCPLELFFQSQHTCPTAHESGRFCIRRAQTAHS